MARVKKTIGLMVGVSAVGLLSSLPLAANTALPAMVNCTKSASDPHCKDPTPESAGSVGAGPAFFQTRGFDQIRNGFVRDGKLFLAVEIGGQQDSSGGIYEVNLANGNRRVVSGLVNASQDEVGGRMAGSPAADYNLGNVRDVKPLPNGHLAALVNKGTQERVEILEIDPKSGDRRLIWAHTQNRDTNVRDTLEKQLSAATYCKVPGDDRKAVPETFSFGVDAASNFYLLSNNNPDGTGMGLFKVDSSNTCTLISGWLNTGAALVGKGYKQVTTSGDVMRPSLLSGDTFYYVSGPNPEGWALVGINLKSGDRKLISLKGATASSGAGKGDVELGQYGLALGSDGFFYSSGLDRDFGVVKVDLKTGNRSLLRAKAGPLSKGIGDEQYVFTVPDSPILIVARGKALYQFNPATGMSNLLSY